MSKSYRKPFSNSDSSKFYRKKYYRKLRCINNVIVKRFDENSEYKIFACNWDIPYKAQFEATNIHSYIKHQQGWLLVGNWRSRFFMSRLSGKQLTQGMLIPVVNKIAEYPLDILYDWWAEYIRK